MIYVLIMAILLAAFLAISIGIAALSNWLDRHPPQGGYPPRYPGPGCIIISNKDGKGPIQEP